MKLRHPALLLAAMLAQLVSHWLPPSAFANVLEYAGLGYVTLNIALTARDGYLRRLPYWTRDSWRRYFRACAIQLGGLMLFFSLLVSAEFRLPVFFGAAHSVTVRVVWTAVLLALMFRGLWGLFRAIDWLTDGDASRQFTR